jgi:hypothetical protein
VTTHTIVVKSYSLYRIQIDKAIFITDDLVPLTNNITGTTSEASTGYPSGAPELIPEF